MRVRYGEQGIWWIHSDSEMRIRESKFEKWAWNKVPPGTVCKDYWHFHPLPSHPGLLGEQSLRFEDGSWSLDATTVDDERSTRSEST
jgi:hypothetical protein